MFFSKNNISNKRKESQKSITPRSVVFVLSKADKGESYWPKLLSTPKPNFLKTDFSRWKDEDDEEEVGGMNPYAGKYFFNRLTVF
jgi:hypothetical protein